ncbi:carboxymuconolactone decarboxylase family protein [Geitlerinema sp. CS-897]|nr:carboxymuconolactone decarboxylase family protein [Geitlerinema sp. CS-897]
MKNIQLFISSVLFLLAIGILTFQTLISPSPALTQPVSEQLLSTELVREDANRFQVGLSLIDRLNPEGYDNFHESLASTSPELVRFAVEFPYGDIISRAGLDLKSRQIATVAALAALGDAQPQLKFHIQGALNVGCTQQEIVELITQISAYAGFPRAINAMMVAKEVFQELDENTRS